MALSTDYVLRTGAFEPAEATINPQDVRGSCECSTHIGGWGRTGHAGSQVAMPGWGSLRDGEVAVSRGFWSQIAFGKLSSHKYSC